MTIATQTYDDLNDSELVRRAQFDSADFAPLYLRYRDRVLRYCFYRLGDRAEAEDAASAVFVKAPARLAVGTGPVASAAIADHGAAMPIAGVLDRYWFAGAAISAH